MHASARSHEFRKNSGITCGPRLQVIPVLRPVGDKCILLLASHLDPLRIQCPSTQKHECKSVHGALDKNSRLRCQRTSIVSRYFEPRFVLTRTGVDHQENSSDRHIIEFRVPAHKRMSAKVCMVFWIKSQSSSTRSNQRRHQSVIVARLRGCVGASLRINSEFNLLLALVMRTLGDRGDIG